VILDPVYEGKSMAALIDLIRGGEIAQDSHVLTRISAASRPSTPTAASSADRSADRR
jgi:hypothetical protein